MNKIMKVQANRLHFLLSEFNVIFFQFIVENRSGHIKLRHGKLFVTVVFQQGNFQNTFFFLLQHFLHGSRNTAFSDFQVFGIDDIGFA